MFHIVKYEMARTSVCRGGGVGWGGVDGWECARSFVLNNVANSVIMWSVSLVYLNRYYYW